MLLSRSRLLLVCPLLFLAVAKLAFSQGSAVPLANGNWQMVVSEGIPGATNGWEQLVYAPSIQQSVMLSQYHQRSSEPNESLIGYNFDTNSWDIIDMGGDFHTENMPEGGESQGYFGYNRANGLLVYHCCTTGSNQPENVNHDWWYDLVGQTGFDKQTSPKPQAVDLQPNGVFDNTHGVFVMQGGSSFAGTWIYSPTTNTWASVTTNGQAPDSSLILGAMAYSTAAQQSFLFGGLQANGTYSANLYSFDAGTNTWTLITPSNGVTPPGRYRCALAYDTTNNIFLLYGGQVGSQVLNDTWVYDPVSNTWTQLTPSQQPPVTNSGIFTRLAYDSDHNVFVLAQRGLNGYFGGTWTLYAQQTWLFRYAGNGPNPGNRVSTATVAPGFLNRNVASWGKDPAIGSGPNGAYVAWSETGSPFDPTEGTWPHIFVDQIGSGNPAELGTAFNAISTDVSEAHSPSMTVIGGTPWVSFYEENSGETARVMAKYWDGQEWDGGAVGTATNTSFQSRSQLVGIGSTPYIALLEINKGYVPQEDFVYVKDWVSSAWSVVGNGPLNRGAAGSGTTAASVSISTDGTYPYVAWTEYLRSSKSGTPGADLDTNPQVYASVWNGSSWTALGGSLNTSTTGWAYDAAIAVLNGTPYVTWTERTQTGNAQLYVSKWNGSGWAPAASGSLNRNASGWAFHPSIAADSNTNCLYIAWVEQPAFGQPSQTYVSQLSNGSWTSLGGALNVNPSGGSAQRASLTLVNDEPVVAWAEVNLGAMRQVYAAAWNGSAWVQQIGSGATDTTAPTTPANLSASEEGNQVNLFWSPSTDLVGVTGYSIYRNGSQIGTATSQFAFTDTNVTPNTPYSYTVAAYDAAGNLSRQSNAATVSGSSGPPTISSMTLGAQSVLGGSSVSGNKIVLSAAAPSGGATISLQSNNSAATVPATITVAAGTTTSAAFTISTTAVSSQTPVTITATYGSSTATASLSVNPPGLSSITLSPTSVVGGSSTSGNRVILNSPAPSGGITVSLASSNANLTVPSSVNVAAGQTASPMFTINTQAVASPTPVTISATYNGVNASNTLTVLPPSLASVSLSSATVVGGNSTTVNTVVLNGPAPSGGISVSLSASDSNAGVPATVTVPSGSNRSPSFTITTSAVSANDVETITATYNGISKSANLTITPAVISSVSLSPASAIGGVNYPANNKIVLNGPAPAGGISVALSSNNSGVSVPASVTIGAGATSSAAFAITTSPVASSTTVVITATYKSALKTANLTVNPAVLTKLSISPASVVGGNASSSNQVVLNGPAPAGGATVNLSSSSGAAVPPVSVTIAAGATTSSAFSITTSAVSQNTTVTITASYNGTQKTATLTVEP